MRIEHIRCPNFRLGDKACYFENTLEFLVRFSIVLACSVDYYWFESQFQFHAFFLLGVLVTVLALLGGAGCTWGQQAVAVIKIHVHVSTIYDYALSSLSMSERVESGRLPGYINIHISIRWTDIERNMISSGINNSTRTGFTISQKRCSPHLQTI